MNKRTKNIVGIGSALIYSLSLITECYLVNGNESIGSFGLSALLLGWMNFDLIGLIWLANPLYTFGLILFFLSKESKTTFISSLIAFILALYFTQIDEITINEAGHVGRITKLITGYWLWLSAIFLLLGAALLDIFLKKNQPNKKTSEMQSKIVLRD